MRAVLITGPPGSGKTSVLTALVDALSDDDVAHAALEVEAVVGAPGARRRAAAGARAGTVRRPRPLLVGDTIETEDELAQLIEAIGADEASSSASHAPGTLAERIIAREPPHWSGLAALVAHARAMPPWPAPTSC